LQVAGCEHLVAGAATLAAAVKRGPDDLLVSLSSSLHTDLPSNVLKIAAGSLKEPAVGAPEHQGAGWSKAPAAAGIASKLHPKTAAHAVAPKPPGTALNPPAP